MNSIKLKTVLKPFEELTPEVVNSLIIGESFLDLSRLGLIGEYIEVPESDRCPRLFYRWDCIHGKWITYAIDVDLIKFNIKFSSMSRKEIDDLLNHQYPTEEPPTSSPSDEPTEEPTSTEPAEVMSSIFLTKGYNRLDTKGDTVRRNLYVCGSIPYRVDIDSGLPIGGNFISVSIKMNPELMELHSDSLKINYKGMIYGKSVLINDTFIVHIDIRAAMQIIPIRLSWTDEIEEDFKVVIAGNIILEDERN